MLTGKAGELSWVEVPFGMTSRLHSWIVEILGYRGNLDLDRMVIEGGDWDHHCEQSGHTIVKLYFKDPGMVLLFKMRWGGRVRL